MKSSDSPTSALQTMTETVKPFARALKRLHGARLLVLVEIAGAYCLIQAYIWHWQFTHPSIAWAIVLFLLATHWWHRDSMAGLGLRIGNFFPALKIALLVATPFALLSASVGMLTGRIWAVPLNWRTFFSSVRYTVWGTIQQYGLQGHFHNRLMRVVRSPIKSSAFNSLIFMSFHFPNPTLMVFTLLGGFILSLLYARNRNIFALGLVHGVMGLLVSNSFPRAILRNMRVGPGYYR